MMNKKLQCYLLIILLTIALSSHTQGEIRVQDDRGKWITLSKPPQRIISLAPNLTEIVYFLELEDKLIAVSTMCDYPPEAQQKPKVGGFNPSVEKIISLQPDLILATTAGNRLETIRRLELLEQSVFVTSAKNIAQVFQSTEKIGRITGKEELAVLKTDQLRKKIELVTSRIKRLHRPRVLYIIWHQPLMTTGGNTFLNSLITLAGGRSISEDIKQNIAQLSREEVIMRDPEIIFLPTFNEERRLKKFLESWKMVTAVKKEAVFQLNEDLILRPGPRIADGLELMARTIHPEAFEKQ